MSVENNQCMCDMKCILRHGMPLLGGSNRHFIHVGLLRRPKFLYLSFLWHATMYLLKFLYVLCMFRNKLIHFSYYVEILRV